MDNDLLVMLQILIAYYVTHLQKLELLMKYTSL